MSSTSSTAQAIDDDETARRPEHYQWLNSYDRTWEADSDDDTSKRRRTKQPVDAAALAAEAETRRLLNRREQRQRAFHLDGSTVSKVRRGLNRHLVLIMDLSRNGELTDYRPCRAHVMLNELAKYVEAFFDQNPISQMAVVSTHHGIGETLTELSGNCVKHLTAIKAAPRQAGGDPSLENALRVAHASLSLVPRCGSREILVGYSSLTTCDPTDINQLLDLLDNDGIRVSILGMGAEVRICRHIVERTNGVYHVALDKEHLHELLLAHLPPPVQFSSSKIEPALIKMGFPYQNAEEASLCSCHREIRAGGFFCPQCLSKYCELPVDCSVCGLSLISSPQLARSYHHLFPISMFVLHPGAPASSSSSSSTATAPRTSRDHEAELDDNDDDDDASTDSTDLECHGCRAPFTRTQPQFECPSCHCLFCFHCDELIHESLHVCPGCEGAL